MSEKKSYQSWTISDEFWERIKEDITKTERKQKKDYEPIPKLTVDMYEFTPNNDSAGKLVKMFAFSFQVSALLSVIEFHILLTQFFLYLA